MERESAASDGSPALGKHDALLKRSSTERTRKDSEKSSKGEGADSPAATVGNRGCDHDDRAVSPRVPRKIINNWRQACDKTKDKTRELLKKWRTVAEPSHADDGSIGLEEGTSSSASGWSEHVWTAWAKRSDAEDSSTTAGTINLTEFQRQKLAHFFISFLDLDRDDVISLADFDAFSERLRHFSNWSKNCREYDALREVQRGFIETFLLPEELQNKILSYDALERKLGKEQLSLDRWLGKWSQMLNKTRNYLELPLWLRYFPKILFRVINRSGTGEITRNELSSFYSSILSLSPAQLDDFVDSAFLALTSNRDHPLTQATFRLSFANFLLGRYPNGPGQYLLGPISGLRTTCFPIDYKALCYAVEDLEPYSPKVKTNRRAVIV